MFYDSNPRLSRRSTKQGALIMSNLEDAAIICERRDSFGHTHKDVARAVRQINAAVERVLLEAVTGDCPRAGYAMVPLEALTELRRAA